MHKLRAQLAVDLLEECVARYWVLTYLLCVIVILDMKKKFAVCLGLEFPFCTSLECFHVEIMLILCQCIIYKFPKLYILVLVPLCLLDHVDGVGHVKLYVAPVSRTATEADVSYHFP